MSLNRRIQVRFALSTAAALLLGSSFATSARASEELGKQEGVECTVCHDKPGSKLLTDKGKYFETIRSFVGYDQLKADFGTCTSCHVRKPGSKKLTSLGRDFQGLVRGMSGLREWMQAHHPSPPSPPMPEAVKQPSGLPR